MHRKWQFQYCFVIMFIILSSGLMSGCVSKKGEETGLSEVSVSLEEESEDVENGENEEKPLEEAGPVFVHVCGEVRSPGVYELPPDSRIYEALEAAGGMTEAAAFSYLNQAERVNDGQQIYVPSREEAADMQAEISGGAGEDDGKISLNTASKEELMTLSGIGEVKAEAIIRYREDKGGFTSIEELKEIEGIKEGVFNKVKNQIKI